MIFQDLLHGYLDGSLSDADTTEFFHIISVSPEKRAAFNDQMALRAMMVNDRVAEAVPTIFDNAILAAAMPNAIAESAPAGISVIAWKTLAGLAAIAIVASGIIGYFIGDKNSNNSLSSASAPTIVQPMQSYPIASSIVNAIGNSSKNGEAIAMNKIANEGAFILQNGSNRLELSNPQTVDGGNGTTFMNVASTPIQQQAQPIQPVAVGLNSIAQTDSSENGLPGQSLPVMQSITTSLENSHTRTSGLDPSNLSEAHEEIAFYQIDVQQGGGMLFPRFSSSSLSGAPLINYSAFRAGVYIAPNAVVGLSAGQSAFALRYNTSPAPLTTITYIQYINAGYAAAYFRYAFSPMLGFTPRALIELGGTTVGPYTNAQVEAVYAINRFVFADLGIMGSSLLYRHNGAWFGSQKLGVSIGMGTEF